MIKDITPDKPGKGKRGRRALAAPQIISIMGTVTSPPQDALQKPSRRKAIPAQPIAGSPPAASKAPAKAMSRAEYMREYMAKKRAAAAADRAGSRAGKSPRSKSPDSSST